MKETRLFSNLRPTTREHVHSVTRGHFRSRDKDDGHTIRSVIAKNPMLHANLMALSVVKLELQPIEILHCENRDFDLFVPVALILTRWPSYTNVTCIPWRYTGYANMNFLRQSFRK